MSRSFKNPEFGNDLFPGVRRFVKNETKRKIRRGKEIGYADYRITALRFFSKIENYMGKPYKAIMK